MSWPLVEISDIAEIFSGAGFPKEFQGLTEGDYPFAKVGDISKAKVSEGTTISSAANHVSSETASRLRATIFPTGSIVFAKIGEAIRKNNRCITTKEMAFDNNVMGIHFDQDTVLNDFAFRFLDTLDFHALSNSTTVPSIRKGDVGRIKIPLPPLEEQKRIAGILDQADALRRLRTHALDKLNALGQEIFHEMFGDPLKEQRNSPDWTLETLDDSISYIDYRGKTPPKAPIGIRLITAKNVKMGYINPEPMEFILEEAFSGWMTRGFPKKGDVLFTTEAPLGNVAILDSDQILAVGQRLLTMQPDHSKIVSEYLAFYLRTPEFTKRMIENSSGSTVRGIKSKLLKKIEICYPPLRLQERFAEALNAYNSNKLKYEIAAQGSHALFASLQHRAFRGEL